MKRPLLLFFAIFNILFALSRAQAPETFQEAKNQAAESGKPILMEFLRPG